MTTNPKPNELIIELRTSIPGNQIIRFEPSMVLKNLSSNEKSVLINPLKKLNQKIIDKVPENLRKKQFFNTGLFYSLNNFLNSSTAKSLLDATSKGYVDNNILVTLDTILPKNSVIYISGKPYVIIDSQWTKGDWRIDTKHKPLVYDINKLTNPFFFNAVVNNDILSGNEQLKQLPQNIIYGSNYNGPKNNAASGTPITGTSLTPSFFGGPGLGPGFGPGGPGFGPGGQLWYGTPLPPPTTQDIASAVAAAVAALPPPPVYPALPAPPTADEIAASILAAVRALAMDAYLASRPGGPHDPRLLLGAIAGAIGGALPAPPVPPTAADIAAAVAAAVAALPPPPAYPALPGPPTVADVELASYNAITTLLRNGIIPGGLSDDEKAEKIAEQILIILPSPPSPPAIYAGLIGSFRALENGGYPPNNDMKRAIFQALDELFRNAPGAPVRLPVLPPPPTAASIKQDAYRAFENLLGASGVMPTAQEIANEIMIILPLPPSPPAIHAAIEGAIQASIHYAGVASGRAPTYDDISREISNIFRALPSYSGNAAEIGNAIEGVIRALPPPPTAREIAHAVEIAVAALRPPEINVNPRLAIEGPTPQEYAAAILRILPQQASPNDIAVAVSAAVRATGISEAQIDAAVRRGLAEAPQHPAGGYLTGIEIAEALHQGLNPLTDALTRHAQQAQIQYIVQPPPDPREIEKVIKKFTGNSRRGIVNSKRLAEGIVASFSQATHASQPRVINLKPAKPAKKAKNSQSSRYKMPKTGPQSVSSSDSESSSDEDNTGSSSIGRVDENNDDDQGSSSNLGPSSASQTENAVVSGPGSNLNPGAAASTAPPESDTGQITPSQISSFIELNLISNRSSNDIATDLLQKGVPGDIINVFFTVKKVAIPESIKNPTFINAANDINEYINENTGKMSDADIFRDLKEDYPYELIADVFTARETSVQDIPGIKQKISAEKKSQDLVLPSTEELPLFSEGNPPSFRINDISGASNAAFRKCYRGDFYNLLNTLFINSVPYLKRTLRSILRKSTSVNVAETAANLSRNAYNESLDNLVIIKNKGGGNCFFIAVAQAINYYNFNNQNTRIIYKHYGVNENEYTQEVIREIIYEYYSSEDPNIQHSMDEFFGNAPVYVEDLNTKFAETMAALHKHLVSSEQEARVYRQTLIDTYKGNQNFLTTSVFFNPSVAIPQRSDPLYFKPYKVLERENLREYMLSDNYWAGGEALTALCSKNTLELQVVPLSVRPDCSIINTSPIFDLFENDWKRYLFLYESGGHFELITFNYNAESKIKKTIFVRDDNNPIGVPPIYILFIIYGMLYSNLTEGEFNYQKQNFPYNNPLMVAFENTIKNIKQQFSQEEYVKFYQMFIKYFPNTQIPKPSNSGGSIENIDDQEGGYNRGYNRPPYRPNYVINTVKKGPVSNESKIAYYITLDLQLYPGTTVPPEMLKNLTCNHKWNSIRKSYSTLVGKPYNVQPIYSLLIPDIQNKIKNNSLDQRNNNNYRTYNNYRNNNNYRNYDNFGNQINYGGKLKKTIKKLVKKNRIHNTRNKKTITTKNKTIKLCKNKKQNYRSKKTIKKY